MTLNPQGTYIRRWVPPCLSLWQHYIYGYHVPADALTKHCWIQYLVALVYIAWLLQRSTESWLYGGCLHWQWSSAVHGVLMMGWVNLEFLAHIRYIILSTLPWVLIASGPTRANLSVMTTKNSTNRAANIVFGESMAISTTLCLKIYHLF